MSAVNTIVKIFFWSLISILNIYAQVSLEIGSGSTVEINNNMRLDISGNWTNMGSFIPGKSWICFIGYTNQKMDVNGEESFYNLTVSKPAGFLQLNNDIFVQNKLELLKGNINSVRSVVTIGQEAAIHRKSGYIIGTQKSIFNSPGKSIFEIGTINGYTPVEVKILSGKGDISLTSFEGSYSKVSGTSVLQRYWTVKSDGIKKADLIFHYLPEDISGIEANYVAGNFSDNWIFPKCEINPLLHIAAINGVNPSGDWTIGVRDALNPAQISLNFTVSSNNINLSWQIPSLLKNYVITLERADYWFKDWKTIAGSDELNKNRQGNSFIYTDNPPAGRYLYRLKQSGQENDVQYSNEIEVIVELPGTFSLDQNFPNPFNSETKITYSIPVDSKVSIVVFGVTGQIIAEPVSEFQSAGKHTIHFDASNLASGTYLYKITAGSFIQTKKMVVLR